MDDVIQSAKSELVRLKSDRASLDAQISKLEGFLNTYDELASRAASPAKAISKSAWSSAIATASNKRQRVEAAAERVLADGVPRSTKGVLMALKTAGVEIGGTDERQSLAVYLSNAKEKFKSDRKHGWSLKKAEPQDASTS